MTALDFFLAVMGLSSRFKFSVQSWGRSVQHNRDVKGQDDSMHLYFLAIDCTLDDPSETPEFIAACKRLGLVVVKDPKYLHVQIPRIMNG